MTTANEEEMAKVDASTAMILFVTQSLIQILKQWASEEQKDRFFGRRKPPDTTGYRGQEPALKEKI